MPRREITSPSLPPKDFSVFVSASHIPSSQWIVATQPCLIYQLPIVIMDSCAKFVPARFILAAEEVPLFIEWQQQHYSHMEQPGNFRYASDYYHFTHRHDQVPSGTTNSDDPRISTQRISTECGHLIHPSDTRTSTYCPVCRVTMELEFLNVIADAYNEAGGPFPARDVDADRHQSLCRGWHMARRDHEKTLSEHRQAMKHELAWEAQNPSSTGAARKTNTSAKAVRLADLERKYPAVVCESPPPALRKGTKRRLGEPVAKRKVSFAQTAQCRRAPDDQFSMNINSEPSRERAAFRRNSSYYEPGIHAAPEQSEWVDTSHYSFDMESANLCNNKVFVTTSREDFDEVEEDLLLQPGELQGVIGNHPAHQLFVQYLRQWAQSRVEKGKNGKEELKNLIQDSDSLIALVSGDDLLDVRLARSLHVEEEHYSDADEVNSDRWTCFRECIGAIQPLQIRSAVPNTEAEQDSRSNPWKRLRIDKEHRRHT